MRKYQWLGVMFLLAPIGESIGSGTFTAPLTVKVTIIAAPCEINSGKLIDVDFGDEIAVTDVAAGLVEKEINYDLNCSNMDTAKSLKMEIDGDGADFNADVLKTSITDLGVKIEANGADYHLNTALNFDNADSKPALKAVLVQKPGARLQTGEFTAGATMKVDYQ